MSGVRPVCLIPEGPCENPPLRRPTILQLEMTVLVEGVCVNPSFVQ
jgi:hypothetical protein